MSEQNIQNPFDKENKNIYELFDCFIQKVLKDKKSMFDNTGLADINDNLKEIETRFIDNGIGSPKNGINIYKNRLDNNITLDNETDEYRKSDLRAYKIVKDNYKDKLSFAEKLNYQFNEFEIDDSNASNEVKKLMTHILWLRYLPISDMVKKTKPNYINLLDDELVKEEYIPNGIADYSYKRQNVPEETKYIIELLIELCKIKYLDSKDIKAIKDEIKQKTKAKADWLNYVKSNIRNGGFDRNTLDNLTHKVLLSDPYNEVPKKV